MFSVPTLVSLLLLAISSTVQADPCVSFDVDFNLLAFGFNGKDWNAGKQDTWTSGSATDITADGRPPFDGTGTTCYLAQFFNAVYFINADKSNPSAVHIYDAGAKSWSTQSTTTGKFDPTSSNTILDHDTNVFYSISKSELYALDMGEKKAAGDTVEWVDVQSVPYGADYDPVMALAQNHIHFINVPNVPAGSADIFVIHFSFFQPDPQSYPGEDGSSSFPAAHGQTASFFQAEGVQQEFAFIPDDGSFTYVINVENNSTHALAGPSTKDADAKYAASITALVQLDSKGAVFFIPYEQGNVATNSKAAWASVSKIPVSSGTSSDSSSSSSAPKSSGASKLSSGAPPAPTGTGAAAGTTSTPDDDNNGAMLHAVSFGAMAGSLFAVIALLL